VQPHEAARLPMIYAAAWDVTGDDRYHKQYRHYLPPAIKQSQQMKDSDPHAAYVYVQVQCSFEVLHQLEQDPKIKAQLRTLMQQISKRSVQKLHHARNALFKADLTMTGPDWRQAEKWIGQGEYRNPQWGAYRHVWHVIREAGELSLVPLMEGTVMESDQQQTNLEAIILKMDYEQCSSCGIIYHLAAYWKARKQGLFQADQ